MMENDLELLRSFLRGGSVYLPAAAEAAAKLYKAGKLSEETQLSLLARLRPMESKPYLWGGNVWPFFSYYFEGDKPCEAVCAELLHLREVAQSQINGKFHAGLSGNPAINLLDAMDECRWME